MSETITLNKEDLATLLKDMLPPPRKLLYLSFPQDIVEMLKDVNGKGPAESTVRNWKTSYGLRTIKIGNGSYVSEEDWLFWVENNKTLFAAAGRTRGDRLGRSRNTRGTHNVRP